MEVKSNFETQKNIKATGITAVVCVLLFIIFFFVQWTIPVTPPPIVADTIEVNLGNSETGLGDIAPEIIGAPAKEVSAENEQTQASTEKEQIQNIQPIENSSKDEPEVSVPAKKAVVPTPIAKPIIEKLKPKKIENIVPPTPKPKAQMGKYSGGNGNGGTNSDTYNGVKNQGIAGGKGDQGQANGNPNSDSYKGIATANSGVSIKSGLNGRRIAKLPNFEDEFNESAKVAVDITVLADGSVATATINPRGTTTTNATIRNIALRKAKLLKMSAGVDAEQNGTIVFNFKLKG